MEDETDFIVVGSGIAGLRAAVALATCGRVEVLTMGQVLLPKPLCRVASLEARIIEAIFPSATTQISADTLCNSASRACSTSSNL